MDSVTRDTLAELARTSHDCCVSIQMPAHRSGPDVRSVAQEDVTRWKNLVRDAHAKLAACLQNPAEADRWMTPAFLLFEDEEFWRYQSDGLAAFLARNLFRTYRVPLHLEELVVVAPQFHITPLLPLLTGTDVFYVLAFSQNRARLIEASRDGSREVVVPGMPRSMGEALRFDEPQRDLQSHVELAPGSTRRERSVFHGHGHGAGDEDDKENVLRYSQQVDRAINAWLRDATGALVVAATEPVEAIYRQANRSSRLLAESIPGNPDDLSARELQTRAWPIVERTLHASRDRDIERYRNLTGGGRVTSSLESVLRAADDGRVDVLFEPLGIHHWGRYDKQSRTGVVHHPPELGDEDLLNVAAVKTLLTGGTVYAVAPEEMPEAGSVAAVLRY